MNSRGSQSTEFQLTTKTNPKKKKKERNPRNAQQTIKQQKKIKDTIYKIVSSIFQFFWLFNGTLQNCIFNFFGCLMVGCALWGFLSVPACTRRPRTPASTSHAWRMHGAPAAPVSCAQAPLPTRMHDTLELQ
jgi:hypothetical protein